MFIHVNEKSYTVPPSLVRCIVNGRERAVSELSPQHVAIETCTQISRIEQISIGILSFRTFQYETKHLQAEVIRIDPKPFSKTVRINFLSHEPALEDHLADLVSITQMPSKVRFNNDKLYLYRELLGDKLQNNQYPYERDSDLYSDFSTQLMHWNQTVHWDNDLISKYELALDIHTRVLYRSLINYDFAQVVRLILEHQGVYSDGLEERVRRFYVGNEFCTHLQVEESELFMILDKALCSEYQVTWCTSYVPESQISAWEKRIERLAKWCTEKHVKMEIVFNDWGTLQLLKDYLCFIPVLGRLLNTRKKDPRIRFAWGYEKNKVRLQENMLNAEHIVSFLKDYRVNRYEFELHPTLNKLPSHGKHTIHFPYYQIGTSVACTLNALCKNNNRYLQRPVTACPEYCRTFAFLYPKHLNILGYQNSMFGFTAEPIKYLNDYIDTNADRIVYTPILENEEVI